MNLYEKPKAEYGPGVLGQAAETLGTAKERFEAQRKADEDKKQQALDDKNEAVLENAAVEAEMVLGAWVVVSKVRGGKAPKGQVRFRKVLKDFCENVQPRPTVGRALLSKEIKVTNPIVIHTELLSDDLVLKDKANHKVTFNFQSMLKDKKAVWDRGLFVNTYNVLARKYPHIVRAEMESKEDTQTAYPDLTAVPYTLPPPSGTTAPASITPTFGTMPSPALTIPIQGYAQPPSPSFQGPGYSGQSPSPSFQGPGFQGQPLQPQMTGQTLYPPSPSPYPGGPTPAMGGYDASQQWAQPPSPSYSPMPIPQPGQVMGQGQPQGQPQPQPQFPPHSPGFQPTPTGTISAPVPVPGGAPSASSVLEWTGTQAGTGGSVSSVSPVSVTGTGSTALPGAFPGAPTTSTATMGGIQDSMSSMHITPAIQTQGTGVSTATGSVVSQGTQGTGTAAAATAAAATAAATTTAPKDTTASGAGKWYWT